MVRLAGRFTTRRFAVLAGVALLAVVVAGAGVMVFGARNAAPAGPLSATRPINCSNLKGSVSTQGVTPDINCLVHDGAARLDISTRSTPLPTPLAKPGPRGARTPAPAGGSSESTSRVEVHNDNHSSASTSDVTIEQNSNQSASGGNATNTNSSSTSITITNH